MLVTDNKSSFYSTLSGSGGLWQKSTLCTLAYVNVDNFERRPSRTVLRASLTGSRHAERETLLQPTELAAVARLRADLAVLVVVALLAAGIADVLQRAPEKSLRRRHERGSEITTAPPLPPTTFAYIAAIVFHSQSVYTGCG